MVFPRAQTHTSLVRWGQASLAFGADDSLQLIETVAVPSGPSVNLILSGAPTVYGLSGDVAAWSLTISNDGELQWVDRSRSDFPGDTGWLLGTVGRRYLPEMAPSVQGTCSPAGDAVEGAGEGLVFPVESFSTPPARFFRVRLLQP